MSKIIGKDYVDISQAPVTKGDLIEYVDEGQKEIYVFRVLEVQTISEQSRTFKVKVVKATGHLVIGSDHIITVPRHEPVLGFVYRERMQDDKTVFRNSGMGVESAIVNELKAYLDSKTLDNFNATWKEVVVFFMTLGIGPIMDMKEPAEVSKYLRKIVSRHKSYFKSEGGYVRSLKPSEPSSLSRIATGKEVIEVDINRVYNGIRLLIESGLFGRVRIVGKE